MENDLWRELNLPGIYTNHSHTKSFSRPWIENLTRWESLSLIGRSKAINSFYYLVFIVPLLIKLSNYVQPSHLNERDIAWFVLAYFSVISVVIGHATFFVRAPAIFKHHSSQNALEVFIANAKRSRASHNTVTNVWSAASKLRPLSRLINALAYTLGAIGLLIYAFRDVSNIIYFVISL